MSTRSPLRESGDFLTATQRVQEIVGEASTPDQAIRDLIDLGKDLLDVENVHVTQIEPTTDYWEAIESTDPQCGIIVPGQTFDLGDTYCRRVIQADDTIALSHAAEQEWGDDRAYDVHGLECYLGTPIRLDGELFGTACFVAQDPRSEPFATEEQTLAELIGFELGHLIEQRRLEAEVERREQLSAVLRRILRHNLRNTLTVMQGRIEILTAQLDDEELSRNIDALRDQIRSIERLSDKSLAIDPVISPLIEREDIQLGELLTTIVERVHEEYPEATFETTLADTTVHLAPSVERAFQELIENAVKHGGEPPVVEIRTHMEETAVVVEIVDNGSGLPEYDQQIFEHRVETPLEHGSGLGLWLVWWIIDNHDGDIEANASTDGTRIQVRLPYTESLLS